MIKINIIAVGDIKEKYLKEAIDEYSKRLTRFCELKIIELKENVAYDNSNKSIEQALIKDATIIEKYLKGYVIALCVEGGAITSTDFANKIKKISLTNSEISFIIGASNGLHDSIKNISNEKISFSYLTFPHQLMRVILLEQLYRAFTIINNISYHK